MGNKVNRLLGLVGAWSSNDFGNVHARMTFVQPFAKQLSTPFLTTVGLAHQALQIGLLRCAFSQMYRNNIQLFLFTLFVRCPKSPSVSDVFVFVGERTLEVRSEWTC